MVNTHVLAGGLVADLGHVKDAGVSDARRHVLYINDAQVGHWNRNI